ncbi:MAG: hypothetical protein COU31_03925 [Candidatus Magasanikbacteria bacterium CG10_big_fil_rev_8_21_14_0_10_40_10]|uniref:Penicillin-binding protein transpeptidase domain-containing protein n=1 Tax=Candidatus Magasanikbacteria bacterium CG10_big_fil_rev_8_21_14_0_10_40_10 TaxID=1974648 RepID=A0A2M6W346_9BACT|nr:MAG: hypothetical protein COU31_03925 [Candidatus Magasanikbacteria bacterium CG10_big_fil_rev_8_21_14_0_10_40_10]
MLSDDSARAYMFGANSLLTLPGRKVAVKTGTTDDSKDAWTMGYTPSLAVGVWVGNTKPSTMLGGGSTLAGPIWNDFMRQALDKTPAEDFDAPIKEEIKNPFLQGSVGGITLRVNKKTGKIASSSTLDELIVEKTFLPPHTILHYVDKDNPNSTQSNSQTDPQYDVWEEALQQWIAKQQQTNPSISISDPPTEYDTVGSSEMLPSLEIISPLNSSTLYSRQIKFEIKASAPRGISDVSYYLGDTKIGSSNQFPFSLNYYAQSLEKGKYTFKVIASDDQNNNAQAFINIDLQAELDPPSFEWSDSQGLTLKKENFPGAIFLTPFRWTEIKEIKIYLKSGANENLIYTFDSNDKLVGNKLNFTWKTYPGAGDYQLKGVMTDKQNKVVEKTLLIKVE